MQAGEAHVIVGAVCSDVLVLILFELIHELKEVFLATSIAHVVGREVTVHSRTVPITSVWFTVILYIHSVLLAQALQNVAGNPDLVTSIVGSFSKDLKFPLALGDFAVDAFVVNACI